MGAPVAVDLMNTLWADRDGVHDALAADDEVQAWLAAVGSRPELDGSDLPAWLASGSPRGIARAAGELRVLRDAARRLAAEVTDDPRPVAQSLGLEVADAADALSRAAALAPAWPVLTWRAGAPPHREIRTDVDVHDVVVARLAGAAIELFGGRTRTSLRACLAPGCVLYFVKQHPRREWCSSECGNRARVARHYQRHHARADQ